MTTQQMNRLENISKNNTRNLEGKYQRRYKTKEVCLTIIQPPHLEMGWVIMDAQSDLGHVLRNVFNKWSEIIFTVRVCRRWRDVIGKNNVSTHIKVLCEDWSGLRKGLHRA